MSKLKLPIERVIAGSLEAILERSNSTDVMVICYDRNTGQMDIGAYPKDKSRTFDTLNRAGEHLSKMERQGIIK